MKIIKCKNIVDIIGTTIGSVYTYLRLLVVVASYDEYNGLPECLVTSLHDYLQLHRC